MSDCAVAYVPVLHDGYRSFVEAHAQDRPFYVIGPRLYVDDRPLAKDIRALDAKLVASAIASWSICSEVSVLDVPGAKRLAKQRPFIVLPDEDVSHEVANRFFADCEIRFDGVFLRWDRRRTRRIVPARAPVGRSPARWPLPWRAEQTQLFTLPDDAANDAANDAAANSVDWWRKVGAAIVFKDGEIRASHNEHHPHPLSPYAVGDPRSNFAKGLEYELSTAAHAEARLIAQAARNGWVTDGAEMYVTDFPCPSCAKLIANAGIRKLVFRKGYAVLDGEEVLAAAGVEVRQVN